MRADFERRFEGIDGRFGRLESTVAGMGADMERRFEDVDRRFDRLEVAVAETRAELRNEIRKGDEDTRSQLKVLIEAVDYRVKLVAEGHVDHDRRIRALENR